MEKIVNPYKIDIELIPQIEDFVKKGKNAVIFIDCFDQILLVKGFDFTFQFSSDIKNICEENNSIFLMSFNPNVLDENEVKLFKNEFEEIKDNGV